MTRAEEADLDLGACIFIDAGRDEFIELRLRPYDGEGIPESSAIGSCP
jgi:hypothetical protein